MSPSDDDLDPVLEQRLVEMARSLTDADRTLLAPPADLWADIAAAVRVDDEPTAATDEVADADAPGRPSLVRSLPGSTDLPDRVGAPTSGAGRRRPAMVALAAAAAVAVVIGAVGIIAGLDDGDPSGELVASSDLDALSEGYRGMATLRETDGRFELELDLEALPDADAGYYELWLIKDLETGEMQSLGPIEASGTVALPAGLDPSQYAVVDISVEPLDGVPTHSGQSVLRGALEA